MRTPSERAGGAVLAALLLASVVAGCPEREGRPVGRWQGSEKPPSRAETVEVPATPPSAARSKISLNQADIEQFDRLPGIGPTLARRIADYRERHGPFQRIEGLLAIRGIGPKLLARLRHHVTLDSARAAGRDGPREAAR